MKKTRFNPKRKQIEKQIKENPSVAKQDFLELVKRASQPKKND